MSDASFSTGNTKKSPPKESNEGVRGSGMAVRRGAPPNTPLMVIGGQIMQKLITAALKSTAYAKVQIKKTNGVETIRPSLNLIIIAGVGVGKSSLLGTLSERYKIPVVTDFTVPGLIGTVDKNGQVIPGAFWRHRRKLLLFDEFYAPKILRTVNAAIEPGIVNRQLGHGAASFADVPTEQDKKEGLHAEVVKHECRFKTRFSFVCVTLKHPLRVTRNDDLVAFCSRAIIIEWRKTRDEILYETEHGHTKLDLPQMHMPIKKSKMATVSCATWTRIMKLVGVAGVPVSNIKRCAADLAKYQLYMKWDDEMFKIIIASHGGKL